MRILALNTAWAGCETALIDGDTCLAERSEEMARDQDSRLPGLVQETIAASGVALAELDRLAVITGPGSFTGIRVGVAFARGLALALNIPCLGVTSLEAALPIGEPGSSMVLLAAQRRPPDLTYWTQGFRNGVATGMPDEVALDGLVDTLTAHPHALFGDGDSLKQAAAHLSVTPARPRARIAAQLALSRDPDTAPPTPTYVRAPDAKPRHAAKP
ncbi:MAG: tRNA (adenosine(37)-N6)-threonylcarbamoyltransferase complex dimerization subunit type 1 TsaB [Pseudomonadota bacterium]